MGFQDIPWKTNPIRAIQIPGIWIFHDAINMIQTFYDHIPHSEMLNHLGSFFLDTLLTLLLLSLISLHSDY